MSKNMKNNNFNESNLEQNNHGTIFLCKSCAKCCFETEMELSEEDIERIEKLNPWKYKREDFCIHEPPFYILKNIDGKCIFLDKNTLLCKIYEFRPTGCRFYPLLYDLDKNSCKLDNLCPKGKEFYPSNKQLKSACKKLRKWLFDKLINKFNQY
ncbi:MAG: YkgJ family cysteine cluster protein [Promethearchaeota archaeon]